MNRFPTVATLLGHHCIRKSKSFSPSLLFRNTSQNSQLQFFRNLLLQTVPESVKMEKLSESDAVDTSEKQYSDGDLLCFPSHRTAGIIEVKLDRPEAKNAIGKDMLRGLQHTLESIEGDSTANVVMLSSAVPRVFCAGADLKERKLMAPSEVQLFVNSLRSVFSFLEALSVPTIAVVEGVALGGGLEMILSCDLRICGEDAVFGMPETGLAIIPGAGGTQRLPRIVGKSVAKELIFTGRKIVGEDAMSMGLINYCVPAGEAYVKALEIAREINQKGPLALRMAKRAINEGLEVQMSSALALEEECYEQLLHTQDRLEGLAAFAEKRKPIYIGE